MTDALDLLPAAGHDTYRVTCKLCAFTMIFPMLVGAGDLRAVDRGREIHQQEAIGPGRCNPENENLMITVVRRW